MKHKRNEKKRPRSINTYLLESLRRSVCFGLLPFCGRLSLCRRFRRRCRFPFCGRLRFFAFGRRHPGLCLRRCLFRSMLRLQRRGCFGLFFRGRCLGFGLHARSRLGFGLFFGRRLRRNRSRGSSRGGLFGFFRRHEFRFALRRRRGHGLFGFFLC